MNQKWLDFVKSVGVPTAILFYIMMNFSPKLDKIIEQQGQIINVLLQEHK